MGSFVLKLCSISRHVFCALIVLASLGTLGYSIYMVTDCKEQTSDKSCALSRGEDICETAIFALICISVSILVMAITSMHITYKFFLTGVFSALCLEFIWFIVYAATDDSNYMLTRRSSTQILNEIRRCRVIENTTYTGGNYACWEHFRYKHCNNWQLAEMRICVNFGYHCENSDRAHCDNVLNAYTNSTPVDIIETCIDDYDGWVQDTYAIYHELCYKMFMYITNIHLILFLLMAWVVYSYGKHKIEDNATETVAMETVASYVPNNYYT